MLVTSEGVPTVKVWSTTVGLKRGDTFTVGISRDKKESHSTRRGLRVGSGFRSFRQTLRCRGFILLGFTFCLSTLLMLEFIEAVRGRLNVCLHSPFNSI